MGTFSMTFLPNHDDVKNNPKVSPQAPKTASDGALKIKLEIRLRFDLVKFIAYNYFISDIILPYNCYFTTYLYIINI